MSILVMAHAVSEMERTRSFSPDPGLCLHLRAPSQITRAQPSKEKSPGTGFSLGAERPSLTRLTLLILMAHGAPGKPGRHV